MGRWVDQLQLFQESCLWLRQPWQPTPSNLYWFYFFSCCDQIWPESRKYMTPFHVLFLDSQEKPVTELLLLRLLLLIWEYVLIYSQEFFTDCISSKVCMVVGTHPDNFSKLQRLCSLQFLRSLFFNSLKYKKTPTFFPLSYHSFTQELSLPSFSQQTLSQTILTQ